MGKQEQITWILKRIRLIKEVWRISDGKKDDDPRRV